MDLNEKVIAAGGVALVSIMVAAATQAMLFQRGLQQTIDTLRKRIDQAELDIRDCVRDRAALRQQLRDLKVIPAEETDE